MFICPAGIDIIAFKNKIRILELFGIKIKAKFRLFIYL